ncbi:hypothetical protein ACQZV8_18455 [Magnetococcales bacterium HHB-1]
MTSQIKYAMVLLTLFIISAAVVMGIVDTHEEEDFSAYFEQNETIDPEIDIDIDYHKNKLKENGKSTATRGNSNLSKKVAEQQRKLAEQYARYARQDALSVRYGSVGGGGYASRGMHYGK